MTFFILPFINALLTGIFAEKHGTCASPVTGDEYNYFITAINLYFKYNVTVSVLFFLEI